jgi:hypothetical protein
MTPVDADILEQLAAVPPPKAPAMSKQLEAELGSLGAVTPRRPRRQLALLAAVSFAYAGLLLAVLRIRDDISGLPVAWILGAGALWLTGFVLPAYLALVPRPGSMMPRWALAAVVAAIASVAYMILGLSIHPSMPGVSRDYGWAHFFRGHGCLWLGLATALVPVILGVIFLRGALVMRSRWVAAALGAAGGCVGGLLLHMHCPIADGPHIGLIHGGVVLVAAALTAALAPRATDRAMR